MTHFFDVEIAKTYGLNEAIIFGNLVYWTEYNKANQLNFHDGMYWTYNSVKAFSELFPYLSKRKIENALRNLKDFGLIVTGNYNELSYDRTLWYAITEKGKTLTTKGEMELHKKRNGTTEKGKPIPDNKPDNKHILENVYNTPLPPKGENHRDSKSSYLDLSELDSVDALLSEKLTMWVTYRAELKKKLTQTGFSSLVKKCVAKSKEYGVPAVIALMDDSMSNGYQGIIWDKLESAKREDGNGITKSSNVPAGKQLNVHRL